MMPREDYHTNSVDDAARWARQHAADDDRRPTKAELVEDAELAALDERIRKRFRDEREPRDDDPWQPPEWPE